MEKILELEQLVATMKEHATKFYNKGVKDAAVKARKVLQDIKAKAQEIREDIQNEKKANEA